MLTVIPDTVFPALPVFPKTCYFQDFSLCFKYFFIFVI